jgi:PAS domain S-box-containing protein
MVTGPTGSATSPASVVRRAVDALNHGDLRQLRALLAPDVVEHVVPHGVQDGLDAVLGFYREVLGAVPDLRVDAVHLAASGETVLATLDMTGTFTGAALHGIEPTGARIRLEGAATLIVRDGLVASVQLLYDEASCARQIGLLPARGSPDDRALVDALNARTRLRRGQGWLTEAELAQLLPQDELAVIATDVDGVVTAWNPAAERLYGWTRAEVLGRPITALTVGPDDVEVAEAIMAAVRESGRWEGEFWVHRKDGTRFLAHVREAILADDAGVPLGLVGVSVEAAGGAGAPRT